MQNSAQIEKLFPQLAQYYRLLKIRLYFLVLETNVMVQARYLLLTLMWVVDGTRFAPSVFDKFYTCHLKFYVI